MAGCEASVWGTAGDGWLATIGASGAIVATNGERRAVSARMVVVSTGARDATGATGATETTGAVALDCEGRLGSPVEAGVGVFSCDRLETTSEAGWTVETVASESDGAFPSRLAGAGEVMIGRTGCGGAEGTATGETGDEEMVDAGDDSLSLRDANNSALAGAGSNASIGTPLSVASE
jgi:hypothetical protein